jgi:spore coat polysaccharide biosynthesis protein SpsF
MIGAIVQARMGSTRLPGKVMKEVLGRPLLFYLLERLKRSKLIEKMVVATTDSQVDQPIVDYVENLGIQVFRGDEEDVLDRYYQAAKKYNIDTVVRITADCPLVDPKITDEVIRYYLEHQEYDLVRTGPTYPEGFDTEVFSFESLETAWKEARLKSEREHVTSYIWKNNNMFKVKTLVFAQDLSYLRITVDEKVDFEVVKLILENLYREGEVFYLEDILRLYWEKPEVFNLNQKVIRNEGYLKSLREDRVVKVKNG